MGQYPALPGRLFQDGGPGGSWGHEAHLHRVIGIYLGLTGGRLAD